MTESEEDSFIADLASAEPLEDSLMSVADLCNEPEKVGKKKKRKTVVSTTKEVPSMTDTAWSDYVLAQFTNDELDDGGRPFVTGLRRVARKLLGPVLASSPTTIQSPSYVAGFESMKMLMQPAVVEFRIKFLIYDERSGSTYEAEFGDVADCYYGNTDPDFARHSTATASTRAEARAYRKALQLTNVIAAEEVTRVPIEEAALDGMITPDRIRFIDILCSRNNINVMKYLNMGKKQYDRVESVPDGVALKMVEYLSTLQNSTKGVPDNLKGYDKEWRSN